MESVCRYLVRKGRPVSGFLSLSRRREGRILGYDMLDIPSGRSRPYIRLEGEKEWERVGPYFMIPEAVAHARAVVHRCRAGMICVVDEVGPLEMSGGGLWKELQRGLARPGRDWMLVIREAVLSEFREVSGINPRVFDIRNPETPDLLRGVWERE